MFVVREVCSGEVGDPVGLTEEIQQRRSDVGMSGFCCRAFMRQGGVRMMRSRTRRIGLVVAVAVVASALAAVAAPGAGASPGHAAVRPPSVTHPLAAPLPSRRALRQAAADRRDRYVRSSKIAGPAGSLPTAAWSPFGSGRDRAGDVAGRRCVRHTQCGAGRERGDDSFRHAVRADRCRDCWGRHLHFRQQRHHMDGADRSGDEPGDYWARRRSLESAASDRRYWRGGELWRLLLGGRGPVLDGRRDELDGAESGRRVHGREDVAGGDRSDNWSHMFAATDSGLYVTTDGGAAWAKPADASYATFDGVITSVVIDPATPANVYIAGPDAGGIVRWRSRPTAASPGRRRTPVSRPRPRSLFKLAIAASGPSTLYVSVAGSGPVAVYKTTNGAVVDPPARYPGLHGAGVRIRPWRDDRAGVLRQRDRGRPTNPNHVVAGGIAAVETTDGGVHWTNTNGDTFPAPPGTIPIITRWRSVPTARSWSVTTAGSSSMPRRTAA